MNFLPKTTILSSIDIGILRGKRIIKKLAHQVFWTEYYQQPGHTYEGHQVILNGLCKGCFQRFKVVHYGQAGAIVYYTDCWNRLCSFDLNERWFTNRAQNQHEDDDKSKRLKNLICKRFQIMI